MQIPTVSQAKAMLTDAGKISPGPWTAHSYSAAENAKYIAEKCADLNPESAYIMGLLHDIGRREGFKNFSHLFDGYDFLSLQGYPDAARICLTHSFPVADINIFFGKKDCTDEQFEFLKDFLLHVQYTDYDRLIQLCDAISMPQGAVLMEKRFVDVATRYGLPDFTLRKWQAFLKLKDYFDDKTGCNIYTLLPNIVENTFDFSQTERSL